MAFETCSESTEAMFTRYSAFKRLGMRASAAGTSFVGQRSADDAGIACLTMVLSHFGRDLSLQQVSEICRGNTREHVTLEALLNTASLLGLRGRSVKVPDEKSLKLLPFGSTILVFDTSHYVVLLRGNAGSFEVLDPALGRRKISIEELEQCFAGIALTFESTELYSNFQRGGSLQSVFKKLILSSGALPKIILLSGLVQVLGIALPMLTGVLVDKVLPRGDGKLLTVLLVGATLLIVFEAVGTLVRGYVLLHMRTLIDARMTLGFLDHLVSLPYAYFQRQSAGDLMMRLNANSVIREELTASVLCTVLDGIYMLGALAVLFMGSTALALAALVAGAAQILMYFAQRERHLELSARVLDAETKAQNQEVEMLSSMETLKASGNEERTVAHWSNLFVNSLNATLERDRFGVHSEAFSGVLQAIAPLLILAVGATQVMNGELSLGIMIGLNGLATGIVSSMSALVDTAVSFQALRTRLSRVTEVLKETPEQDRSKTRLAPRLSGAIELERVSFRYSASDKFVVKDASVNIEPGQFCAIVGRSGSGKSTLAKLILGLYRPVSGRILLDGLDAKELDLRSVRQQLGIVSQQFGLFGAGIRENIALGDPSLSLAEIEDAAQLACIHDEIEAMPLGYSTPLIDGGAAISGGQKQRLALARALVRKPSILLLDEATSALDAITERQIQESLDSLRCTRIVIAHRLSTVRRADLILVVDDGQILERGTHQALMNQAGLYAQLVESQLA